MNRKLRILLASASTLLLLASIGFALWRADWRYGLPTPRPANLVQTDRIGAALLARLRFAAGADSSQAALLVHVYNPGCPCSRFNRDHVLALAQEFGTRVAQLALIELPADSPLGSAVLDEELGLHELAENDGRVAEALGVYSTPQALLIRADGAIFYRGNYNSSRYCTLESSAYVRQAVLALLAGRVCPPMPPAALRAYGCELPNGAWSAGHP